MPRSRTLATMRRLAKLVCLFAGFNLAMSPVAMPHAHVHSDHADVYVHGGHDHALASAWVDEYDHHHADDSHDDDHHAGDHDSGDHHAGQSHKHAHDATTHHEASADGQHIAHAHIVELDKAVADSPTFKQISSVQPSPFELIDPPPIAPQVESVLDSRFKQRVFLLSPSRGPPRSSL